MVEVGKKSDLATLCTVCGKGFDLAEAMRGGGGSLANDVQCATYLPQIIVYKYQ
jgi:hypothetical protein